jgi:hypothetical protein
MARPLSQPPDGHPMYIFSSPRLTRREKSMKQEVDAYLVNEIENSAALRVGRRVFHIESSVDLEDAECDGLTFKRRLVQLRDGTCYLMARWKPDRYMRRAAAGKSQKWFLDKEVFPTDAEALFAKHEVSGEGAGPAARS